MTKNKENKDIQKIVEIVTGEKQLRDREEQIKKLKKQAIEEQKNNRRKGIVEKKVKIKKDPLTDKEVVQNIKLFEWTSPDRYKINFDNKKFLIIVALTLMFSLLLAILGHYLLMAAIMSLLFVLYVSGTTKPIRIKHKITARGIDTTGKLFEWYLLDSFFLSKKDNTTFLVVKTQLTFPRNLLIILPKKDLEAVKVILLDKLLYEDIRKWTWLDKITYGEYIPLEKL